MAEAVCKAWSTSPGSRKSCFCCARFAQMPADTERATGYGAVGEIPGAMFKHFMATFQSPGAPDPHDVAEAIAQLVSQPKGSRPARTVVGAAFGSDIVNRQTAPVQADVVQALGLSHLAKVA